MSHIEACRVSTLTSMKVSPSVVVYGNAVKNNNFRETALNMVALMLTNTGLEICFGCEGYRPHLSFQI